MLSTILRSVFLVFISSLFFVQPLCAQEFNEPYRPQFHFSPPKNWTNDPNGLVFYKGEYHLFYQHNPFDREWGFMHWGHAVSEDLVHWQHLPIALYPDEGSEDKSHCTEWSGSAVVDWNNVSGLQSGDEHVLLAFYTSWGCGQRLAFSNDRGRTWEKYSGNPVIPQQEDDARDPKVFWHEPSDQWIMALYRRPDNDEEKQGVSIYTSKNLLDWQWQSHTVGFFECPDLFELPIDGDPENAKWVLLDGDGSYLTGSFDGTKFLPDSGKITLDYGANFYATQSYSDIPKEDGRRIQVAWMRGGQYPDSVFNQQMSFPTELTLRSTADGVRIARKPVQEIESLYERSHSLEDEPVSPGKNILSDIHGDLFEIKATIEIGDAEEFGFTVRKGNESEGTRIVYNVERQELECLDRKMPLKAESNTINLHILIDRASIEIFGNDGVAGMSNCFVPKTGQNDLELFTTGGNIKVVRMEVHQLKSAWR